MGRIKGEYGNLEIEGVLWKPGNRRELENLGRGNMKNLEIEDNIKTLE